MKLTRKSYNRRIYTFGTLIFLAIALISTGFASWVMSTNKSGEINDGSFAVGTITDGSLEFKNLGFVESEPIIKFNPAEGDDDGEIKWDGVNAENLSVTIKGSITPESSFKELKIELEKEDKDYKIPAGILAAVEKKYIVLPDCAQEGGVTINTTTTIPESNDTYINVNKDDKTQLDFTYTITFGWGEAFGGMNPSIYLDDEENLNPTTNKPYTFADKLDVLMEFRKTIYPSLKDKTDEEILTGTGTAEEVRFGVNLIAVAK